MTHGRRALGDIAGGVAATACAVHCGIAPWMGPMLGWASLGGETGEIPIWLGAAVGLGALLRGWWGHGNPAPLLIWLPGTVLACLAHAWEGRIPMGILGAALLAGGCLQVAGHAWNHRCRCRDAIRNGACRL